MSREEVLAQVVLCLTQEENAFSTASLGIPSLLVFPRSLALDRPDAPAQTCMCL